MPSKLKGFLLRWAINTLAVWVATYAIAGIDYDHDHPVSLLIATLLLGIFNAFLRPLLMLLGLLVGLFTLLSALMRPLLLLRSLPLVPIAFGLLLLLVNSLLLYWVGHIVKGFYVKTFLDAFLGALIISATSLVLNSFIGFGDTQVRFRRGPRPTPRQHDHDDGGPVIDI